MTKPRKALLHTSLLLLVLIIAAFLYLDRIVGAAVEQGASRSLGVRTGVGGVELALLRGHVGLTDLEIANPEGFPGDHFLRLGSIRVEVSPRALREDTIVIPSVIFEDLELVLAGSRQGTNYGRILANVQAYDGGGSAAPAAEPGAKKFVVNELVVRNVKATLSLDGFASPLAGTTVEVPEIRLRNFGAGRGGLQLAELVGQVMRGVLFNVVGKQPELASQLAEEVGKQLQGGAERARQGLERLGGALRRNP